jgi:hypothetical protein
MRHYYISLNKDNNEYDVRLKLGTDIDLTLEHFNCESEAKLFIMIKKLEDKIDDLSRSVFRFY